MIRHAAHSIGRSIEYYHDALVDRTCHLQCDGLLQGKLLMAIEYYHKALGLRSEDSICAQLLQDALKEHAELDDDFLDI